MTDLRWPWLEHSIINLNGMVSALQIAIEQMGTSDQMTTDLLGLIRNSLGSEIENIEKIWEGLREEEKSRPRLVNKEGAS